MMGIALSLPTDLHTGLLAHLRRTSTEQVAFLYTAAPVSKEPLRVVEIDLVPTEDFEIKSAYHVTLADEMRSRVIGRAWRLGGALVEVHTHVRGDPATFSFSDIDGLKEWVPHVRWRLGGKPYIALVFADETFDALVWDQDSEEPGPLLHLQVDAEERLFYPTGITYSLLSEAKRDR